MALVSFEMNLSTLMPVLLGVTLVRFLVMGHYALSRKVYPGFRSFIYAEFFGLLGMAVIALRSSVGEQALLVGLSNLTTLLHPALIYYGLGTYGRAPHLRARNAQNLAFVGFVCLLQLADILFAPDMARRVAVFSAAMLLLDLRIGLELPLVKRRMLPGGKLLCLSYLLMAGFHAARGWTALGEAGYDYVAMMRVDQLVTFFLFFRILQSILELYVLFAMNSMMLEEDLRVATAQIERLAQTDDLTGALNRRGLDVLGAEALRKCRGQGQPAAVIMLDLDWFKQVNDSLGHAAGDELLRSVAALCSRSLRADDVFARYGGEEFVVVAPFTDVDEAERLAQRMRQAIETARFPATDEAPVTASFGVASSASSPLRALIEAADVALYAAKEAGRNRVVVAGAEGRAEPARVQGAAGG